MARGYYDVFVSAKDQVASARKTSVPQISVSSLRIPVHLAVRAAPKAAPKTTGARKAKAATQSAAFSPWGDAGRQIDQGLGDLAGQWLASRHRHTASASAADAATGALADLSNSSLAVDAGINDIGKGLGDALEVVRPVADGVDLGGVANAVGDFLGSLDFS